MSSRRVRIWDCASSFTKENLVSVVTNAVIALSLGQEEPKIISEPILHSEGENLFCTSCQVSISDHSHYKTEWHRVNTKLRSVGAKPVSKAEFENLELENDLADEEEYLEERLAQASSSSSQDAADQQAHTGSARITFVTKANETLAVWKSVLLPGKSSTIAQFAASALTLSEPIHSSFKFQPSSSSNGENKSSSDPLISPLALQALPQHPFQWIILLCQGGFFAGAVFRGDQVLKHKRIAKYTVRRKQGGSQMSKDQSKGGIHSAGASIRRQNEVKLREEIAELLKAWRVEIAQSTRIFLHAPSFNSSSFYYEGSPISRRDPRVRSIPIVTQRPSFVELQRIHLIMSTVEISTFDGIENLKKSMELGVPTSQDGHSQTALDEARSMRSSNSSIYSLTEGEHANWASEDVSSTGKITHSQEVPRVDLLAKAIDAHDINEVKRLLLDEEYIFPIPDKAEDFVYPLMRAFQLSNEAMVRCLIDCGELLDERSPKYALKTLLHVACETAQDKWVETLLSEFDANPTILDLYNHTPYDLAKEKSTRLVLRRFAGSNPELWDYTAAKIPPLTDSDEEAAKARDAEKRKRKKAAQKEKKKTQKEEAEVLRQEEAARLQANAEEKLAREAALERTKKILAMSEREKRALAAERRLNPNAITCDNCGKAITTAPFEKFSFKYCSTDCVVEHKRILDTLQASSSTSKT